MAYIIPFSTVHYKATHAYPGANETFALFCLCLVLYLACYYWASAAAKWLLL